MSAARTPASSKVVILAASMTAVLLTMLAGLVLGPLRAGAAPGDPPAPQPTYNVPIAGVDPEAAGVNEGTKKHAKNVPMRPIDKIDNLKVAGKHGKYGGCTEGYGKGKKCLPPISAEAVAMGMTIEQMPWTCSQVRRLLPEGIELNNKNRDPAGLDLNKDGIACGSGD